MLLIVLLHLRGGDVARRHAGLFRQRSLQEQRGGGARFEIRIGRVGQNLPSCVRHYCGFELNSRSLVISGKDACTIQKRAAAGSLPIQASPTVSISR